MVGHVQEPSSPSRAGMQCHTDLESAISPQNHRGSEASVPRPLPTKFLSYFPRSRFKIL